MLRGAGLENTGTHEDALGAKLHHHRRVGGRGDTPGGEQCDRQLARPSYLGNEFIGRLQFFCRDKQFVLRHRRQPADLTTDGPHVCGRVGDVSGPGLALGPDHGRSLADAPQRLTEIGRPTHERHREVPLVDMVGVVSGRQHLGLVDVVDAQRLQDLRLDKVADAHFSHHRDGDRGDDALDHVGVTHPRHPALGADIGGHPFQRHYRNRTGALGDAGLLRGDNVHDDAALEHLGHAALDPRRTGRWVTCRIHGASSCPHYDTTATAPVC
ncbi:Uncharacterised protein [Mycobacterium tuberculosis]|uniref:Uncharacterized protein n=2 Tax=Mycobacterium tuberculosis TaxID=1773 RepID=A0A654ZUQ8_MYCTX|nr:Uncharacterised protein [Mycobacterium tuberculosis]